MDENDPRLIVTLEAYGTTAERAWNRPQNQDRCLPASESVADISSRESTPAVGQTASQIQLTFDDNPKNLEKGFVFGSDPQICDVFLGERGAGFSGQQFCITFNERGEVIFKNTSRKKAQVDYNGENPSRRNQFTWVLFDTYKNIKITMGEEDDLIFKVKWPENRDSCRAEYEAYRDAYFEERRNALPPLSQLGMESQQTTVVSTAQHSPRQGSPKPKENNNSPDLSCLPLASSSPQRMKWKAVMDQGNCCFTHQLNKSDDLLYRPNPQTGATRSAESRDSIFSVPSERGHLCGP